MKASSVAAGKIPAITFFASGPWTARKHQSWWYIRCKGPSAFSSSSMRSTRGALEAFGTTKYRSSPIRYTIRSSITPPPSFSTRL